MGLLSGLEKYNIEGLGDVIKDGMYEQKRNAGASPQHGDQEAERDYLFMKEYLCPVCESKIKLPTVRGGKAKLIGVDVDLRPRYKDIEPLKYDILCCPFCGNTTLSRFFSKATSYERKFIKESVTPKFRPPNYIGSEIYSYEESLAMHRLGLACALIKKSHASEKAYLSLKAAWLIRSMAGKMDAHKVNNLQELESDEKMFLSSAQEGFLIARETESYPVAGMDEYTLDYLISALSYEIGDMGTSSKLVSHLLTSPASPSRIKTKALELKEMIQSNRTN